MDTAIAELYATIPGTAELGASAEGILVIPRIRQAGFFASGAYGEGALIIGPAKVEYYSMSLASFGFTFGATEYNQALFFMTPQALQDFRLSDGWSLGVGGQVVVNQQGAAAGLTFEPDQPPDRGGGVRSAWSHRGRELRRSEIQPHHPLTGLSPRRAGGA